MIRTLQRLRILDENGDVSWTSVYLGVGAFCMVKGVQVSWPEVTAFVVALAGYHAKKYLAASAAPEEGVTIDPSPRLDALEKQVGHVADEFKALRSSQTWAQAFGKR